MYLSIKKVSSFHEVDYSNFSHPVLVLGGCSDMNAVKTWNTERLKNIIKDNLVTIEVYQDRKNMGGLDCISKKIKFNDFLEHSLKNNHPYYYLAEYPITYFKKNQSYHQLNRDVRFNFDNYRTFDEELLFMGLDTLSGYHLHVEDDYVLNQILGKKTVYLFDYYDNPHLSMKCFLSKSNNFLEKNYYNLSHDKIKLYKVTLNPGDSLMIPPWWFHSVKGHGFSCSITKTYLRTDLKYLYKYKYLGFLWFLGEIRIVRIVLSIFCLILILLFLKLKHKF